MKMKSVFDFNSIFQLIILVAAFLLICLCVDVFFFNKEKKKSSYYYYILLFKAFTTIIIASILLYSIEFLFEKLNWDVKNAKLPNIIVSVIMAFFLYRIFQKNMEEQVDGLIEKVETKYQDYNAYAPFYFNHLFGMKNSFEEGRILKNILEDHKKLAENAEYLISFNTYLEMVVDLLKQGYSLTSVNSTLIPYWYAPINFEVSATKSYITSLKKFNKRVKRITYCENNDWWEDSVKKIFDDLADSEKEKTYAIQWLATLYRAIGEEPSDNNVKQFIGLDEQNNHRGYTFFNTNNENIVLTATDNDEGRKRWEMVKKFLNDNSKSFTEKIRKQYEVDMGIATNMCSTNVFKSKFSEIEEIGLFEKGDNIPITILLLGNVSQAVKIRIVTKEEENQEIKRKIDEIQIKKN